jgi:eukaryotic-like serine/threonine-protein kinase
MSLERMQQIEAIYSETLALPDVERKAFLDRACGGDGDLRGEIESLLGYQTEAETYLGQSAFHLVAESMADGTGVLVDRMLGRYQLLSLVGRGGMAEVYCAVDTRLNRLVAVKVLPTLVASDRERLERFEHEARAVAVLNHPHICTLYDVGSEGETHYLIFEYLVGEPLSARLSRGALPHAEALTYSTEIAEALTYVHEQGIIHLDLKPSNIMLTRSGVKLFDFGVAELHHPDMTASVNDPGTLSDPKLNARGTFGYMSPEQLECRETDSRTDIFAFGVVMYEMFTGRFAFPSRGSREAAALNLKDSTPPISQIQSSVSPAVDFLVERCLFRDPSKRWQSISEVLEQLRATSSKFEGV